MITLDDALARLGYDEVDDTIRMQVQRKLAAAERTLEGSVGKKARDVLQDDERIDELVGIYLEDLYDNRGTTAKVAGATRNLVLTLETQLRLEYRQKLEEQAAGGDS